MALTAQEEALVRQLLDQQAAILSLAGNEATITSKLGATKVTLADLVAASSLADADLLLTRQGTNDKSVTAKKLAEYIAPQVDISTANAGTATKLQNPRTLTIGNTGKSVDGSANVSWSLAEVVGVGVPGTAQELADEVDLNTIQTPGFYRQILNVNAASGANYPMASAGALVVLRNAGGVSQLYYTYGNATTAPLAFFRTLYNGSWSTWREFYHSGNLGAVIREAFNAPGNAPVYACRAWVNFNGTGTVAVRASGNVSSITDNGTGDYTVNFILPMPDANYAAIGTCDWVSVGSLAVDQDVKADDHTTTSVRIRTTGKVNSNYFADNSAISVAIFR